MFDIDIEIIFDVQPFYNKNRYKGYNITTMKPPFMQRMPASSELTVSIYDITINYII